MAVTMSGDSEGSCYSQVNRAPALHSEATPQHYSKVAQGCQLKGRIVKSFDLTLGGRLGATNHVTQKPQHLWDITFCTKISNAAWSSGAISFIPE